MHDLIIVGAGTAGCVLAERMTASGKLRVLLIEAGGRPANRFVSIPAGFARLFKTHLDWALESEPQLAVKGRRIFTPRGKMLGGCSNINGQIHQWCHPADFDGWEAAGACGWNWADVAHIFRAQECWLGEESDRERGRHGPMYISPNRNTRSLTHAFIAAARKAGLGDQEAYNGGAYEGAFIAELTQKKARRFSAYDAYLKPAMQRPNLEVICDAHAAKIIIEEGRATGIALRRDGGEETFAARGVVLSAGSFGSPQLLMLSGIGPAAVLQDRGLPVHVDAPDVGENLQDHPVLPVVFRARGTDTLKSAESPINLVRYFVFKRGMLASNGIEGIAFTRVGSDSASAPNLEIMFVPFDARKEFLEPPQEHAFCLAPAVVAPQSRGRLILRSPDAHVPPGIDFGLLSDPAGRDASILWQGVRLSRKIAGTLPLSGANAGEMRPGVSVNSDEDLLAYASTELQTVYHPTSTCRMGSDPRAVVDPKLRVRGVDSLWVADASVMPSVPSGHPNAVVAMIAERAAGWIELALN
jgi:choline dehydrogenase-like flavoprotein